jgi:hypothetical protein
LRSLATLQEVVNSEGGSKPRIVSVVEQRVTGLCVHILLTFSILAASLLAYVPVAPLYGLLAFMGVESLHDNQFVDRLKLFFTESRLRSPTHYVRKVRAGAIHAFTFIQLICFIVLWIVKR